MKKVFQIKLKNITRVMAMVIVTSLVTFTGCKNYDDEFTKLDTVISDVATLKTTVAGLQTSVNGMTYIKSITMGTDGKLTITPSTGTAIVYDAKAYVTYDITLTGNNLMVNGVNKGTVAIPALTFGADNKLMSGTTVVADLSSWVRTLTLGADNYLYINGVKSAIMIPAATAQSVDVKGITLAGNVLTITKNDNSTSTITLPATAIVPTTGANGNLFINGVDTGVKVVDTFAVNAGGFLTVNGVATTVKIPTENKSTVIINKDGSGNVISATIGDGTSSFTVKVNPSAELLSDLAFVPAWIDGGLGTVEVGYMMDIPTAPATTVKALFTQQDVTFRFNPTSADVSKTTWAFVNRSAKVTNGMAAPGDGTSLFQAPTYTSNNDGSGKFSLKVGTWVDPVAPATNNLFALQANGKDFYSGANTQVVSDFVKVTSRLYNAFISKTGTSFTHYITARPANALFPATGVDYQIVSDNSVLLDLDDVVLATANSTTPTALIEKKFEDYGFVDYKWSFSIADAFNALDATNQNSFITIDADNKIKVNAGSSTISRTPLVKVTLLTKTTNKVLAIGYVKLQIVEKIVAGGETKYSLPPVTFGYRNLFADAVADPTDGITPGDYKEVVLTWPEMNNQVYNKMGLTHNEFRTKFGSYTPTVTYSFTPGSGSSAPAVATTATTIAAFPLITSPNQPDVDTYAMKLQVTPSAKFGTYIVNYKFATTDPTDPYATITFTYTVTKPTLDKFIIPAYQFAVGTNYPGVTTDAAHTVYTQGIKKTSPLGYEMALNLGEGFGFGSAALKDSLGLTTLTPLVHRIDNAKQEFIVSDPYVLGVDPSYVFTQATSPQYTIPALLGTSNETGVKMGMSITNPLNIAFRAYPVNFKTTYPNAEVDNFNYTVIFKNPLSIELETPNDFEFLDIVTGAADVINMSQNYVVKMLGEVIFNKTGVTAKAAEYGILAPIQTYTATGVTPAFAYAFSFVSPNAKWENAGTKLTSLQKVYDAGFTFSTSFAKLTRTDAVNVKPDLSLGVKRK
jgi:outer membrane murein-binding lipoprotein Lpp